MNKLIGVLAFVAVLVVVSIGLMLFREHQIAQGRITITDVFYERLKLRSEYLEGGPNRKPVQYGVKKYADGLRLIDTSSCPKKFRQAWLIYLQAWDRNMNQNLGDLVYEAGSVLQAVVPSHDAHYFLENSQKSSVREAWFYCERVAMEYGASAKE